MVETDMDRAAELYETIRTLGQIGITWWVSATLLCATILGVSWSKRAEIRSSSGLAFHALFGLVTCFFLSIVGFGITMTVIEHTLADHLISACRHADECSTADAHLMSSAVTTGFSIGTTSFVIVTIAWVGAWILASHE